MPRERIQHGKLLIGPAEGVVNNPHAEDFDEDRRNRAFERNGEEYRPGMSSALNDDQRLFEQPSLDVIWNREAGWVQVLFEAPAEWFRKAMEEQAWKADPEEGHPMPYGVGTEPLTREQINNLIRTLRRARNAAFGADE